MSIEAQQFDDEKAWRNFKEISKGGENNMTQNEQKGASSPSRIDSLSDRALVWGNLPIDPAERTRLEELAAEAAGPKGDVAGTLRRLVYQRGRARLGADWQLDFRKKA